MPSPIYSVSFLVGGAILIASALLWIGDHYFAFVLGAVGLLAVLGALVGALWNAEPPRQEVQRE